MGAILCHFSEVNAFFSILGPFWVQFGLLRGHFLTSLHRFLTMLLMSSCHLCFSFFFSVFWYLWWVGWIGVVGNLGVVCWWLGGGSMSRQEHNRTTTRWHSETTTRQHRKKTTREDGKTAGQHDKNTATQQPNNPTTNWCGPVECAKRLNNYYYLLLLIILPINDTLISYFPLLLLIIP